MRHVGIVFVHGIGDQEAGETLLQWGGAVIGLLLDVRLAQKAAGDPVIACELDPGPNESRYIQLQLPPAESGEKSPIAEQLGISVDVFNAARQERTAPTDLMSQAKGSAG